MRDVIIIGIACLAAILLGGWLYFNDLHPSTTPTPAGITVLDQGSYSGSITERKNYRLDTQEEIDELWRMVHGTGAPLIDFSTREVLAVFDGTHSTGGYDISITAVAEKDGRQNVTIVHGVPGAKCLTSEAISSPFQIVSLPKSMLPLSHDDVTETRDCE